MTTTLRDEVGSALELDMRAQPRLLHVQAVRAARRRSGARAPRHELLGLREGHPRGPVRADALRSQRAPGSRSALIDLGDIAEEGDRLAVDRPQQHPHSRGGPLGRRPLGCSGMAPGALPGRPATEDQQDLDHLLVAEPARRPRAHAADRRPDLGRGRGNYPSPSATIAGLVGAGRARARRSAGPLARRAGHRQDLRAPGARVGVALVVRLPLHHRPGDVLRLEPAVHARRAAERGRRRRERAGGCSILEDTGELLAADAKERTGQGLSRLLNVVDGLIGQGLRVLVLVTTNETLRSLHPAVSRPGRCASQIEFAAFTADEAAEWLEPTASTQRGRAAARSRPSSRARRSRGGRSSYDRLRPVTKAPAPRGVGATCLRSVNGKHAPFVRPRCGFDSCRRLHTLVAQWKSAALRRQRTLVRLQPGVPLRM